MVKRWSNSGQKVVKGCSNGGQKVVKRWSGSGQQTRKKATISGAKGRLHGHVRMETVKLWSNCAFRISEGRRCHHSQAAARAGSQAPAEVGSSRTVEAVKNSGKAEQQKKGTRQQGPIRSMGESCDAVNLGTRLFDQFQTCCLSADRNLVILLREF